MSVRFWDFHSADRPYFGCSDCASGLQPASHYAARVAIRRTDGSAGDAVYGSIGHIYARYRQPDPRIAEQIVNALGDARKVLNVGAGAGSYEPSDREVTAVEPSATMRQQRPPELPAAIDGVAQRLPFADRSFDAAMATFSVHQWSQLKAGLSEVRRVTKGPVVILTCDPSRVRDFWLNEYAPEALDAEARRYPTMATLARGLGGQAVTTPIPIPADCLDGFNEAYYSRPEMFLDPAARKACSAWSFLDDAGHARFTEHLSRDLQSGAWDARYGRLRKQPTYEGSLILVVSTPA
jgi:SAM-dependent methyltransferase